MQLQTTFPLIMNHV